MVNNDNQPYLVNPDLFPLTVLQIIANGFSFRNSCKELFKECKIMAIRIYYLEAKTFQLFIQWFQS